MIRRHYGKQERGGMSGAGLHGQTSRLPTGLSNEANRSDNHYDCQQPAPKGGRVAACFPSRSTYER